MAFATHISLYLIAAALLVVAEAALPWDSQVSHPIIKTADIVSFDPLSLLAILWNPRASASAARLYTQPDRKMFRWPHMMQIGAVLVPVSMLVNHLTRNYHSIHPGADMCAINVDQLDVKSTIGSVRTGAESLFSKLPVSSSDSVLVNALSFKPSALPSYDMMVIHIKEFGKEEVFQYRLSKMKWIETKLVLCTELLMGSIILCGTVFSALLGDIWAVVLFATYLFHWLASTAISFRQLVIPDPELSIRRDAKTVFATYARPSGGLVIFKGTQSTLERWARSKWVFRSSTYNILIHWMWIVTGTAAAFASVACMVNMSGYLQLGFLGMLLYSSVAELWLTVLAQRLQVATFYGTISTKCVQENDKRYKSIIQISLGLDRDHRVDELRWIDLGLIPSMPVFQAMVRTMDYLNGLDAPNSMAIPRDSAESKIIFDDGCKSLEGEDIKTRDGVWAEIQRVWEQRTAQDTQPVHDHQV